jgi:hypothetical protein
MSDSDKIKLTVLPTETMHADLTWLLINPANMATKDQPVKQKGWRSPLRPAAGAGPACTSWAIKQPESYVPAARHGARPPRDRARARPRRVGASLENGARIGWSRT